MIAASSVPNLSTFQQESPKKTKKYRIETDSETPYMSDVDYRYTKIHDLTSQSKSKINVQWRRIGQPINDRHFHYLSH